MEKDIKLFKYYKSGILKAPNGSDKKTKKVSLYKLDLQPSKDDWKGYELPPHLDKILDSAVFALSHKAVSTIRYLLAEAPVQRHMPLYYGYDTSVRETLMEIGAKFFEKAVYLLTDYYYDEETQYYCRNNKEISKNDLKKLIIYKYWKGRGGRGLQYFNAGFHLSIYLKKDAGWGNINAYYIAQQIKHYEAEQENLWNAKEKQLSLFEKSEDDAVGNVSDNNLILYAKFIVKINYRETLYDDRGKVEKQNEGERKYLVTIAEKNDAKAIALNEFYKSFDNSESVYEINPITIDSVKIEQISENNNQTKQVSLLDQSGRPIWTREI